MFFFSVVNCVAGTVFSSAFSKHFYLGATLSFLKSCLKSNQLLINLPIKFRTNPHFFFESKQNQINLSLLLNNESNTCLL